MSKAFPNKINLLRYKDMRLRRHAELQAAATVVAVAAGVVGGGAAPAAAAVAAATTAAAMVVAVVAMVAEPAIALALAAVAMVATMVAMVAAMVHGLVWLARSSTPTGCISHAVPSGGEWLLLIYASSQTLERELAWSERVYNWPASCYSRCTVVP
jgi:hypothetical protein